MISNDIDGFKKIVHNEYDVYQISDKHKEYNSIIHDWLDHQIRESWYSNTKVPGALLSKQPLFVLPPGNRFGKRYIYQNDPEAYEGRYLLYKMIYDEYGDNVSELLVNNSVGLPFPLQLVPNPTLRYDIDKVFPMIDKVANSLDKYRTLSIQCADSKNVHQKFRKTSAIGNPNKNHMGENVDNKVFWGDERFGYKFKNTSGVKLAAFNDFNNGSLSVFERLYSLDLMNSVSDFRKALYGGLIYPVFYGRRWNCPKAPFMLGCENGDFVKKDSILTVKPILQTYTGVDKSYHGYTKADINQLWMKDPRFSVNRDRYVMCSANLYLQGQQVLAKMELQLTDNGVMTFPSLRKGKVEHYDSFLDLTKSNGLIHYYAIICDTTASELTNTSCPELRQRLRVRASARVHENNNVTLNPRNSSDGARHNISVEFYTLSSGGPDTTEDNQNTGVNTSFHLLHYLTGFDKVDDFILCQHVHDFDHRVHVSKQGFKFMYYNPDGTDDILLVVCTDKPLIESDINGLIQHFKQANINVEVKEKSDNFGMEYDANGSRMRKTNSWTKCIVWEDIGRHYYKDLFTQYIKGQLVPDPDLLDRFFQKFCGVGISGFYPGVPWMNEMMIANHLSITDIFNEHDPSTKMMIDRWCPDTPWDNQSSPEPDVLDSYINRIRQILNLPYVPLEDVQQQLKNAARRRGISVS